MLMVAKTCAAKQAAQLDKFDSVHVDGSGLDQHATAAVGVARGRQRVVLDASGTATSKTEQGEATMSRNSSPI